MKKNLIVIMIALVGMPINAQQNTDRQSYWRDVRFNQYMEKLTTKEKKLSFSDIEGSPYYKQDFLPARFGNSTVVLPIRYNCITDTVEAMNGNVVYEIPKENILKDSPLSKFIFEKSLETLILVDTHNEFSGYYFRILAGKNELLKKIMIEFTPEVPAPNHLIAAIPAKFEKPVAVYFIKTENDFVKVPKNVGEFLNYFSENKNEINGFIKKNKIKLNQETDLVRLVTFLNAD